MARVPRTYESVLRKFPRPAPADDHARLLRAVDDGDLAEVMRLHEQGVDIRARGDEATLGAAANGHLPVLRYLHEQGADIRARGDEAVGRAAQNGHLPVVRYLHEQGVDIRARNDEAMCVAAGKGHLPVVRYLHEQGVNIRALDDRAIRWAAQFGHLPVLRYLHEQGADIRAVDDKAMRGAAANGHLPVLRYLHEQGVDIRAQNDEAVRDAVRFGRLPVLRYLQEQGADIRAVDDKAMRGAAAYGHLSMLLYLQEQGVPVPETLKPRLQKYEAWRTRHGDCPRGLLELSPHLFRPACFADVTAMMRKENYRDEIAHKYAYHAAGLFRTTDRVLAYLEKWGRAGKQPLHDVIQHIQLPQQGRFNIAAWGDAVLRHGPKMAQLVKFAHNIPEPAKDPNGQWSYQGTLALVARNAFTRAAENPELAGLCFKARYDDDEFEDGLKQLAKYTEKYAGNDNCKTGGRIPDIALDGAIFDKPDYRFYKLPDGDVRGLLLGIFTDCCQHLGSAGRNCAKHGFLSEEGGFYVIADKKKDSIVAQSWAWRGKKDELVLDSLEALSGHMSKDQWAKLCDAFAAAARDDKQAQITAIHIGTGGGTPALPYEKAEPAKPADYDGYRDSKAQFIVRPRQAASARL